MNEFDLDPEEVKRLGYRAAELVAAHTAGLREDPVFGKVGESAGVFDQPLPETGRSADEVLDATRDHVLTHPFGNSHPRFFAFINATADPLGAVAEYLAAGMNSNCWGGDHAAIHVEDRVVRWLGEILGLPASAEGILTSGGSMANFTALAADRQAGLRPAIVVGTAGSVNTGAIDPLEELADLCAREELWFHVDGAYGAMACVSKKLKPLFAGLERADSVAADPHKWLYMPYEAGATLVREPGRLADAFRRPAAYLVHDPDSPVGGPVSFNDRGPELSRGFKALKVWMGLQRHGRRGYAAAVEHDVAMARFLADEVWERGDLELLAEPGLSIVNFRYRPASAALEDDVLDRLNRRIVNRLVGTGAFFFAPTILRGRTSLRVAIVNFRTQEDDLRALLDETARAGKELLEDGGGRQRPATPSHLPRSRRIE